MTVRDRDDFAVLPELIAALFVGHCLLCRIR